MNSLLYIGNKLSKHGFTKTTIETLGGFFSEEGYKIKYASDKKNQILRFCDMATAVVKNRNKVDYVLIDTYSTSSFYYTLVVSQLCRFFKIKYIPILHGGNLPQRLEQNPKLCKMIFAHAYANVAPSRYLLSAFQEQRYTNVVFIPNTVDISSYPFIKEREMQTPKLLWVRSFAQLYNPKMAIDVLHQLHKTHPNAELCMVGPDKDGSLEDTRQYAEQLGVSVTFTGRLTKEAWVERSKNYNVFINTTNFDNTPVSVMEAISLGLPVVTTNVGGIPFLLENRKTALLVEPNASLQMTQAILDLMNNPQLRQTLIENGRSYVENFDWEVVKTKWQKLFAE